MAKILRKLVRLVFNVILLLLIVAAICVSEAVVVLGEMWDTLKFVANEVMRD